MTPPPARIGLRNCEIVDLDKDINLNETKLLKNLIIKTFKPMSSSKLTFCY